MDKNLLILTEKNFGIRIGGIFMFLFSLALILVSLLVDFAKLAGYTDIFSRITISAVGIICGLAFGFGSWSMMTLRDKEIIFDSAQRKLFYRDWHFFKQTDSEHSFSEIVNFGQTHTSTENNDYYENYLHLSNAKGLEIPSNHKIDKDLQDQQIQTIKDFIRMK